MTETIRLLHFRQGNLWLWPTTFFQSSLPNSTYVGRSRFSACVCTRDDHKRAAVLPQPLFDSGDQAMGSAIVDVLHRCVGAFDY